MIDKDIKAVIFDNDGTIADTRDTICAGMNYVLEKYLGKKPGEIDYLRWIGLPLEDQMPKFTDDVNLQKEMVDAYRDFDAINHSKLLKSFSGCRECLSKLRSAGFTLAVATSKLSSRCIEGLELLGIDKYMSTTIGVEHTKEHKPNGEPIAFCASELGVDIDKCVYVGDAPFDIQAAKNAPCISIAVTWGFFSCETLEKENPDYIVQSFEDLSDLLL